MSRVTLRKTAAQIAAARIAAARITAPAAVALAAGVALAGCASGSANQPPGQAGSLASSAPSTAAAPMITLASGAPSAGGATSTGGAVKPADGFAACTSDQIHQTTTAAGAAAGHLGLILVFTNTSGSTCSMTGYPGAAVGNATGTHWNADRVLQGYMGGVGANTTPPTVVLAPNATASAILMWTDVEDPGASCHTTNYTELLTTTPNTQSTVTYQGTYSCENLQITPVVQGSGGSTQ